MGAVYSRLSLLRIQRSSSPLWRHRSGVAKMRIRSMSRHKCLRLRRHWGEDAFLLESLAIRTASVIGGFET